MQYSPVLHVIICMRSSDHAYSDHAYSDHERQKAKIMADVGLRGILWVSIRGICRNQAYTHTICKCWTHSGLSYRYLFISMSQTCLYNIS